MTKPEAERLNSQLAQDQTYQALLARVHDPAAYRHALERGEDIATTVWTYLKQKYGVDSRVNDRGGLIGPKGFKINEQGALVEDHDTRNAILGTAALMAGGYGLSTLPAFGPAAVPAAASAGPAAAVPSAVVPAAAATTAASPSIWKSAIGPLIGAAATVGGAAIGSKGITDAAKTSAEASEKALALQREMFGLDLQEQRRKEDLARADFAPYGSIGRGALGLLAQGTGIDLAANPMPVNPPTNYGSLAQPQTGTLASLNPSAQTSTQPQPVAMFSPTGQRGMVPANRVQDALKAGGRLA